MDPDNFIKALSRPLHPNDHGFFFIRLDGWLGSMPYNLQKKKQFRRWKPITLDPITIHPHFPSPNGHTSPRPRDICPRRRPPQHVLHRAMLPTLWRQNCCQNVSGPSPGNENWKLPTVWGWRRRFCGRFFPEKDRVRDGWLVGWLATG